MSGAIEVGVIHHGAIGIADGWIGVVVTTKGKLAGILAVKASGRATLRFRRLSSAL
jgi:hypothetical protein